MEFLEGVIFLAFAVSVLKSTFVYFPSFYLVFFNLFFKLSFITSYILDFLLGVPAVCCSYPLCYLPGQGFLFCHSFSIRKAQLAGPGVIIAFLLPFFYFFLFFLLSLILFFSLFLYYILLLLTPSATSDFPDTNSPYFLRGAPPK